MPGIHVRSSGKINRTKPETKSVLTIPGSYWLCHKKIIYKFALKYDKESKDTKDFNHEKELMKVIRRIIKLQPRQGQQFGTRNLLVTFSHTSWTRQDKMFAILKFQDRPNASAFSHAFMLTIKLFLGNPSPFKKTSTINNKIINTTSTDNNNKLIDDLILYNEPNSDKLQFIREDYNINNKKSKVAVCEDNTSNNNQMDCKFISNNINDNTQFSINTRSNDSSNPTASFLGNNIVNLPLLEKIILNESSDKNDQDNLNEIQETVDMPYQYLIEREIERSKTVTEVDINAVASTTTSTVTTGNSKTNSKNINNSTHKSQRKSDHKREKRNGDLLLSSRNKSSNQLMDHTVGRSSKITDLLMEGLMFTIRQDEDSVTIVEQKTKLEPDEVLENSEKIQIKEGVDGLINTSLMKLENLVTKIDIPTNLENSDNKTLSLFDTSINKDEDNNDISINYSDKLLVNNERMEILTEKNCLSDVNLSTSLSSINTPCSNESFNNNYSNVNVKNELEEPMDVDGSTDMINDQMEVNEEAAGGHNDLATNCTKQEVISTAANNLANEDNQITKDVSMTSADNKSTSSNDNQTRDTSRDKSNSPRIISDEVVKYDLSTFRAVKVRRRLISNDKFDEIKDLMNEYVDAKFDGNSDASNEQSNELVQTIIITNKNNIKPRRISYSECPQDDFEVKKESNSNNNTIQLWKFLQDMTHGVKVVLNRLDLENISQVVKNNSSTINQHNL